MCACVLLSCVQKAQSMPSSSGTSFAGELKFNSNGEFKIVQFTDLHYIYDDPRAKAALQNIDVILDAERPDLVIVTGDAIWGKPGRKGMTKIAETINQHGVPFVLLFGNHDQETSGLTRGELYDICRAQPNNIQPDRGDVDSPDYVLTIHSSAGDKDAFHIYCLDSHDYPTDSTLGKYDWSLGKYDWLHFDQVDWYRKCSADYKAAGNLTPALAFFHIPLPEFREAINGKIIGTRLENECSPDLNSGMFLAMQQGGDVMGIFCGHDHDNDYVTTGKGVLLGYGRYSGGNTVYNHLPRGARVIVLKEGERRFETYIREQSGNVLNRVIWPDAFIMDDATERPVED